MSASALTTAIDSAIVSAISAERALSLAYEMWPIDGPLTIGGTLKLIGPDFQEAWGSVLSSGSSTINLQGLFPQGSPPVVGGGFIQEATASDVLQITSQGGQVDLDGFAIQFAAPYINTGHGINCIPPIAASTYQDHGCMGGVWRRLTVIGHDGNHYAYQPVNTMMQRYDHLHSFGGGGLHFMQSTDWTDYGNLTADDFLFVTMIAGSAHCVYLDNHAGNVLDYLMFRNCEGWVAQPNPAIAGTTAPSGNTQKLLHNSGGINGCVFDGPSWSDNFNETNLIDYPTGPGKRLNSSGGDANIPTNGQSMTGTPVSGTALQNLTGTFQFYYAAFQLNPTGSAAATVQADIGPISGGGFYPAGYLSAPISDTVGREQTLLVGPISPYSTVKFTWANASLVAGQFGSWPNATVGEFA